MARQVFEMTPGRIVIDIETQDPDFIESLETFATVILDTQAHNLIGEILEEPQDQGSGPFNISVSPEALDFLRNSSPDSFRAALESWARSMPFLQGDLGDETTRKEEGVSFYSGSAKFSIPPGMMVIDREGLVAALLSPSTRMVNGLGALTMGLHLTPEDAGELAERVWNYVKSGKPAAMDEASELGSS